MKQRGLHGVDLVVSKLRAVFEAPDPRTARMLLNQVLDEYRNKAFKAMEILEEGFEVK